MGKKGKKEAEAPAKDEFVPLPIESRKVATVVLMLSSPEEEVLTKACESVYRYAEKGDENRSSLVALGAVEPLARLITHEDKAVRRYALMALGVMASSDEVKRVLKKLNVIPTIISKLTPEEDAVVHEFATLCLASLSVDFTCKVQISDHAGLQPLIRLLSSPDPDVKKNSVECIYNLVQDCPNRVAVRELNGLPALLKLLGSEFPVIQQFALRTLESISSTDRETRTALREGQRITRLLELLTTREFSDLHVDVLRVVSNCLEEAESVQLIQRNGGLEKLLQFILTPNSPEIQTNAVKVLSRAAQSGENRKILHEHGVEKILVNLLAAENAGVSVATCQAVAAMSKTHSSRDAFRELDGIRLIVQLLNSDRAKVREAAAQALSGLTDASQENAHAVYEADGVEFVVQLLQDASSSTAVHAAAVLRNAASQDVLRRSIVSHGAVRALLKPLQSTDERVLISATQAAAALACDADARAQMRNDGALPPLVKLLKSSNAELRRNACWAVSVCANDEPTAKALCQLGALEILQDINISLNRRNKFSEAALQKLLDNNLSVKYSKTGRLSFTDITADGFYDPGQVREGHRVPALEEIAEQVINQRRAVITVNGKAPEHTVQIREEREDEKQQDKPWVLPGDAVLHVMITEANQSVLGLQDEMEMSCSLARLVCTAMGGPVDPEKQHEFLWELHLSELKVQLQSNIVPIGMIRKGTYYHRALLFKVLADCIGLSCSLVRGEYGRAWNEVLLSDKIVSGYYRQPQRYIVDLMHQPGNLMKSGTAPAIQYQTI